MLDMASEGESLHLLSPDDIDGLRPSLEQAKKREFADETEVHEIWSRHGL